MENTKEEEQELI